MREDFPDLHNIGFDENRFSSKRADELISDIMQDELERGEKILKKARAEEDRGEQRKAEKP